MLVQTAVSPRRVNPTQSILTSGRHANFKLRCNRRREGRQSHGGRQSRPSSAVAGPAPTARGTHLRHPKRQDRHAGPGPAGEEECLLQVSNNVRVVASFRERRTSIIGAKCGSDDCGVDGGAGRRTAAVSASAEGFGGIGSMNQLLARCRSNN